MKYIRIGSCEDCIHNEVCLEKCGRISEKVERFCTNFKDKSEWVHLPCKVGDTGYCFSPCFDKDHHTRLKVVEEKIVDIKTTATVFGLNFDVDKIGKTIFLTREEAEKSFEDMRKEDENADR